MSRPALTLLALLSWTLGGLAAAPSGWSEQSPRDELRPEFR